MRVVATIIGLLAAVFGGSSLLMAGVWGSWLIVVVGWLPLLAGSGLAVYGVLHDGSAPFPVAGKLVAGLLVVGFVVFVMMAYSLVSSIS